MKEYLDNYINYVDDILKNNKRVNYRRLKEEHMVKIQFFQHERLIHLLVTLFYALFAISFIFLTMQFIIFMIVCIGVLIFLICYVIHYFRLENGVQYLYKQYDEIEKRLCERKIF